MEERTLKRNIIFILLIGIEGLAFGFLDWDSVISDLVYLKYNNKLLISMIATNIGVAKFISTLICIYINDSRKPNKILTICVILCAIGSLFIGIVYSLDWLNVFSILYVIEILILEIYSGYHYAYVYNSLPSQKATEVHSKRISIFKVTFMVGTLIASYFTVKFFNNTMSVITIFSAIVFLGLIIPILNVKNFPKNDKKDIVSLKEKLNLKKYTKYYISWIVTKFLGKFALSSLIVLVSIIAIDANLDIAIIKACKTSSWLFSSIGFWLSAYLIRKKLIVKGDIFCKFLTVVLIVISFFFPYAIYAILVLNGLLNPFNTMSNFAMIQRDKDSISVAQKELIINLFGFFASIISSSILLNINTYLALFIIIITLIISILNEIRLYRIKL